MKAKQAGIPCRYIPLKELQIELKNEFKLGQDIYNDYYNNHYQNLNQQEPHLDEDLHFDSYFSPSKNNVGNLYNSPSPTSSFINTNLRLDHCVGLLHSMKALCDWKESYLRLLKMMNNKKKEDI